MDRRQPRSLLWHRDVALVWWAGLISWVGNYAMFVALPVMVYQRTSSPLATALVVLGNAVPPVVVGQLAGVLVDRLDRREVLIWTNLAMAGLTTGYALLEHAPWWSFALAGLLISSVGQLLGPAEHALLPEVVPRDRLGETASLNGLNNNLARLIGPAAGGVLLGQTSFTTVAILDAATYLVAALLLAGVAAHRPFTPDREPAGRSLVAQWRAGAAVVLAHPRLRALVLLLALVMFGEGFISALLAPFIRDIVGGGASTIGWILSAQAVGGVVGAWWASRIADRVDPLTLLGAAALAAGGLLLLIFNYPYLYPQVWPSIALTALAGIPFALFGTAQMQALQLWSPAQSRGRVFALAFGAMSLLQLAGIGTAGLLAERLGPAVINVDAATYLVAGLAARWLARRPLVRPDLNNAPRPPGR